MREILFVNLKNKREYLEPGYHVVIDKLHFSKIKECFSIGY